MPGPPKRFAQGIGATFSIGAAIAWAAGVHPLAIVFVSFIVVAATLESVWAVCLGCIVFNRLMRWGVIPAEVCESCNDISAQAGQRDFGHDVKSGAQGSERAGPQRANGDARPVGGVVEQSERDVGRGIESGASAQPIDRGRRECCDEDGPPAALGEQREAGGHRPPRPGDAGRQRSAGVEVTEPGQPDGSAGSVGYVAELPNTAAPW